MGKLLGWVLMAAMLNGGVAHAARHQRWSEVKKLAPGTLIDVRREGQAGADECSVISADDTSLTCVLEKDPNANWNAGSGARLVFPVAEVRNVWKMSLGGERHIGRWIAVGVSVALVVAASVGSGVIGGVIAGGVVLAAWTFWYENPMSSRPSQPQVPRRHLVYQSATP